MKKPNIDYLIDITLSGHSGKEKASREKANRLLQKGKEVQIWSLRRTWRFALVKVINMFWLEAKYLLVFLLRRNKPDVIFTRSVFSFGSWAAGKLFKVPVIREVHADLWGEFKLLFSHKKFFLPLLWVIHKYVTFFIKRADGLIFNNVRLEDYFVNTYSLNKLRTTTIPNGCDTNRFYPVDREKACSKLNLDHKSKYMLFIGEVSKWHGVEYLINVQKNINKSRNDIVLLIVGGHKLSESENLKNLAKGQANIVFTGPVQYEDALLYINASEATLIPVKDIRISPGSPIKLYDTVACGKPVITQSNTPGYSDITSTYNLGISCDFRNGPETAKSIAKFLDTADFEFYRQHNRKIALNQLSWESRIDEWIYFAKTVKS